MSNSDQTNLNAANEQVLNILIRKRAVLKATLTRLKTTISKFTIGEDDVFELRARLPTLENALKDFNVIQLEIETWLGDDTDENQISERDNFEKQYFTLKANISKLIEPTTGSNMNNSMPGSSGTNLTQTQSNVRLPVLNLPKFSGSYTNWIAFRDTFKAVIHTSSLYSNIEKFYYLRDCLEGDAYRALESVSLSDSNYDSAWDLLVKRFENRRLIIQEHINQILNSPTITKSNNTSLRRLIDDVTTNLQALKILEMPVEHWDAILISIITNKFDYLLKRDWEGSLDKKSPTLNELIEFLEKKFRLLETLNSNKINLVKDNRPNSNKVNPTKTFASPGHKIASHVTAVRFECLLCKNRHSLYQCSDFLKLSVPERVTKLNNLKLCLNCFRKNHDTSHCQGKLCKLCNQRHNTLIHSTDNAELNVLNDSENIIVKHANSYYFKNVLLSTALIEIKDVRNQWHTCRALLDVGSQASFITRELCKKLKIPLKRINLPISGISQSQDFANYATNIQIKSKHNLSQYNVNCLVLNKITDKLPSTNLNIKSLSIPANLHLADPTFAKAGPIDLLLGADIYWEVLGTNKIKETNHNLHVKETSLGYIIGGKLNCQGVDGVITCHVSLNKIDKTIRRFWEVENCENKNHLQIFSNEELETEKHFKTTHKRTPEGRYILKLPFKNNKNELGFSKNLARKRLLNIENRFKRDPPLKEKYVQFMKEYLTLNHMEPINNDNEAETNNSFYFPHHAVLKQTNLGNKLRVVFDGSIKTSTGLSLNDVLMVGPTIQDTLFSILLRFRIHQIVLTADIVKMYRQILIAPEDRSYLRILWREATDKPIQSYQLKTVTYGTSCAPFLAIRCLTQLAEDEGVAFPIAAKVLTRDFYVDDVLTGTDTVEEAVTLKGQLQLLLLRGGFLLSKWASNSETLLPKASNAFEIDNINFDKDGDTKTLGLFWNCKNDILKYECKFNQGQHNKDTFTKRSILSVLCKIFDPLGLISPIIIKAKVLMQELWVLKIGWDEPVPLEISTKWKQFLSSLPIINEIQISRKVIRLFPFKSIQIHGFCDSSLNAFGCCVYLKVVGLDNQIHCNLICAKSRVAPVKTQTLPRLELCGALLLAQLVNSTLKAWPLQNIKTYYWSDSTIVLSWLNTPANQLKTFCANRVSEIQTLTAIENWQHINTKENPADIVSRGMHPSELKNSSLWFHGPSWLCHAESEWPQASFEINTEIPEKRKSCTVLTIYHSNDLLERYSCFNKLLRTCAWCLRFIGNIRNKPKTTGSLTCKELEESKFKIIRLIQFRVFERDITNLKNKKPVSSKSHLKTLNPFLDTNNLIRIGGRLANAPNISFNQRHPIVLPKHHITSLIIESEHKRLLHSGPSATLANLRLQYWPLSGKRQVKKVIKNCLTCFRNKPRNVHPMMGNLPKERFEVSKPFVNTGIDYAGPITIKNGSRRSKLMQKSYVCLFVCMTTKAIHLELCSDLTTETFLAALKRFIARRGLVNTIFSDNATSFVGADRELKSLSAMFQSNNFKTKIIDYLTTLNINWKFIPARSPHFGGIWEAGIKSMKFHLRRVLGNALLTYEEFYTLLAMIEACLNSRPLCPLSTDPDDMSVLTPGHFLVGSSLMEVPEPSLSSLPVNHLSRWQYITKLKQQFWRQWQRQYLGQLQPRTKWYSNDKETLIPGALVLLKDDNTPPLTWKLGRIAELHPGADGINRVATIKVPSGQKVQRAVRNVCVLPNIKLDD